MLKEEEENRNIFSIKSIDCDPLNAMNIIKFDFKKMAINKKYQTELNFELKCNFNGYSKFYVQFRISLPNADSPENLMIPIPLEILFLNQNQFFFLK